MNTLEFVINFEGDKCNVIVYVTRSRWMMYLARVLKQLGYPLSIGIAYPLASCIHDHEVIC